MSWRDGSVGPKFGSPAHRDTHSHTWTCISPHVYTKQVWGLSVCISLAHTTVCIDSQNSVHFLYAILKVMEKENWWKSNVPAFTRRTAHSPGDTPCRSPSGPMHMVAAIGLPDVFNASTAHTASSTCSKYWNRWRAEHFNHVSHKMVRIPLCYYRRNCLIY